MFIRHLQLFIIIRAQYIVHLGLKTKPCQICCTFSECGPSSDIHRSSKRKATLHRLLTSRFLISQPLSNANATTSVKDAVATENYTTEDKGTVHDTNEGQAFPTVMDDEQVTLAKDDSNGALARDTAGMVHSPIPPSNELDVSPFMGQQSNAEEDSSQKYDAAQDLVESPL